MNGFFEYVPGDTFLHKANPLAKLVLAFSICVSCFLSGNVYFLLAIICLNLLLAYSGTILSHALRMLKALLKLSVFLFVLQVFFIRSGNVVLHLPFSLVITDRGLQFSAMLGLRLMGATTPLALMISLTKMSDLSNCFVQQLHIPYQYAFALTTALRFIPLFSSEMSDIIEAQIARGVEFDTKNIFRKIRLILPLCVPLLVTSVRHIQSGAISAQLRGFQLRTRKSGYRTYRFLFRDISLLLAAVCLFIAGILI